jgi:peptidoglycan/LPS O-acetylase OafA/YrhL
LAIAWVMVCHANGFGLIAATDYFGWMGVDLFFALSGFLIAGQLFRPIAQGEAPDYRGFFARRLLRTIPAYLAVLALYGAFPALWDRGELQPMWQFLTFTQNLFIDPSRSNSLSHAWSLCVEEQFYLALPLAIVLLGPRVTARTVVMVVLALFAFGMAVRGWQWLAHVAETPFDPFAAPRPVAFMRDIYYPTWCRLDGLLAGVTLSLVKTFRPAVWAMVSARSNTVLAIGIVGVALSIVVFGGQVTGLWPTILGYPLLSVSMAALVAAGGEGGSLIGRRPIPGAGWLAGASYSLYLTHKTTYHLVINAFRGTQIPPGAELLIAVAAALWVGSLLYLVVERPFLRLRDRTRRRAAPTLRPAQ